MNIHSGIVTMRNVVTESMARTLHRYATGGTNNMAQHMVQATATFDDGEYQCSHQIPTFFLDDGFNASSPESAFSVARNIIDPFRVAETVSVVVRNEETFEVWLKTYQK
jgi:hypothetical protein